MKKTLLVVSSLLLFVGLAMCEDGSAYFKAGKFELNVPLKNLKVVSLYDIWQGQGLIGGETQIMAYSNININAGAVSSFLGKGTPFMSLDYNFGKATDNSQLYPLAKLGLWAGYDFQDNKPRAGVKASVPLW